MNYPKLILTTIVLLTLAGNFPAQGQIDKYRNNYEEIGFTRGQVKYFTRNGFYPVEYRWDDRTINKYLKQSVNCRQGSTALAGLGVVTGYFYLINSLLAALTEEPEKRPRYQATANNYLIATGLLFSTSIVINISGKSKIKTAEKRRTSLHTSSMPRLRIP